MDSAAAANTRGLEAAARERDGGRTLRCCPASLKWTGNGRGPGGTSRVAAVKSPSAREDVVKEQDSGNLCFFRQDRGAPTDTCLTLLEARRGGSFGHLIPAAACRTSSEVGAPRNI